MQKTIKRVEGPHKQLDKEQPLSFEKREKDITWLFQTQISNNWGAKKIQVIKWSEITDSDFMLYEAGDKSIEKKIKELYSGKASALVICCEPETDEIKYVIKAYGSISKSTDKKPIFYTIGGNDKPGRDGIRRQTKAKYSYQFRDLNVKEIMEYISDMDCHVLPLTDKLVSQMDLLQAKRKDAKTGVINTDDASLKQMAKEQQARYKTLAKQMKASRLANSADSIFDEITKINDEAISLYKEVISKPENMDMRFDMGDLMRYVSYAYEQLYKALDKKRWVKSYTERHPDDDYKPTTNRHEQEEIGYYVKQAQQYIKEVKERIEKIKSLIK